VGRPAAVGIVLLLVGALGVFAWFRPERVAATLDCPDGGSLTLDAQGVARCGSGAPLPPGQAMTVRQKFDCNVATEDELALVPGIGRSVARELIEKRPDAGYQSWEEIDAVAGVGNSRLNALQGVCELRVGDGGVW
jgi:competence protein ComEA